MAIGFPASLAQFWDRSDLRIQSGSFALSDVRRQNMTKGGLVLDSTNSFRMWMGSVNFPPMGHREMMGVEALLSALTEGGGSFLAYDKRAVFLTNDPTGAVAGITLAAVNANNVDIDLNGFAPGFRLQAGDRIGFTYGSAPVRYAYHTIVRQSAVADGTGKIAAAMVTPPIRAGFTIGQAVTTTKALIKAKIIPQSVTPSTGQRGLVSDGLSFRFSQTLGV